MDCLICERLKNGVLHENEHCAVIKSPFHNDDHKLIVSKDHSGHASAEVYTDAIRLANKLMPQSMIADIPDAVGHWAVRLLFLAQQGKSIAKTG